MNMRGWTCSKVGKRPCPQDLPVLKGDYDVAFAHGGELRRRDLPFNVENAFSLGASDAPFS